jgi:hypothetical protein
MSCEYAHTHTHTAGTFHAGEIASGTLRLSNGRVFTGECPKGVCEGAGRVQFPAADDKMRVSFEGKFKKDLIHNGTLTYGNSGTDFSSYEGSFMGELFHGNGRLHWRQPNRSSLVDFEGAFVEGSIEVRVFVCVCVCIYIYI